MKKLLVVVLRGALLLSLIVIYYTKYQNNYTVKIGGNQYWSLPFIGTSRFVFHDISQKGQNKIKKRLRAGYDPKNEEAYIS